MVKKASTKVKADTGPVDIRYLDVLELHPNPYQPESRVDVDPEIAKKFALSFQEHGLIQTPIVRISNGRYEIADGWLRRAGFRFNLLEFDLQEYAKMPCVVRELTDQQMADMVMEANMVRQDLNAIELAKFYKRYLEDFKIPQVELARRHNCSQGEIANTIRLLDLPGDIQEKIISQEISETHGRQLLRLNYDPELQQKELAATIKSGKSVNELSNSIAQAIYWSSENIDPDDYPAPPFDVTECENCPKRQKIGYPFSNAKKKWRCLDKKCYEKKKNKAEEERIAKLKKEIQAAKEAAPQTELDIKGKGKGKGKKAEVAVVDTSNLSWRDYQRLDSMYQQIDNPEQCKTCPSRTIGKFYGDRTGPICIDVKCFKQKEKAHQAKEAAKTRKVEQELTEKVKAICGQPLDEALVLKVIAEYLIAHSRKDTLDRFGKMYGIPNPAVYFASLQDGEILQKLAALVLQKERYEGETGMFIKMLAYIEGIGGEIDKQIAAFREKYCKGCRHDQDGCRNLMRSFARGRECYYYSKPKNGENEVDESPDDVEEIDEIEEVDDAM